MELGLELGLEVSYRQHCLPGARGPAFLVCRDTEQSRRSRVAAEESELELEWIWSWLSPKVGNWTVGEGVVCRLSRNLGRGVEIGDYIELDLILAYFEWGLGVDIGVEVASWGLSWSWSWC